VTQHRQRPCRGMGACPSGLGEPLTVGPHMNFQFQLFFKYDSKLCFAKVYTNIILDHLTCIADFQVPLQVAL
jgi:hypothetical protein